MSDILSAVVAGASADELAELTMPETYRAAVVRRSDVDMFEGMESSDKDPRQSLHVQDVPLPELAPDEAYVAVLASSINFNTVWTSIFEPLPTFGFLDRLAKEGIWEARHALDYHVVGSDAAGVVLRTGSAVRNWKAGDKVTVQCNYVDDQDPSAHDDSMLAANQRIWASRRTSAASPTSPWSRRTSSCPSPRISAGRRRPSTHCATRPPTGCWCRTTAPA